MYVLYPICKFLGKWVYRLFVGRFEKPGFEITYVFFGVPTFFWCFSAVIGIYGLFVPSIGVNSYLKGTGIAAAVAFVLWLACIPLRKHVKKKDEDEEAEKQAYKQRLEQEKEQYREEHGVAPVSCDVPGYVECPLCHTRQKEGREKCFYCDALFKKTLITSKSKVSGDNQA